MPSRMRAVGEPSQARIEDGPTLGPRPLLAHLHQALCWHRPSPSAPSRSECLEIKAFLDGLKAYWSCPRPWREPAAGRGPQPSREVSRRDDAPPVLLVTSPFGGPEVVDLLPQRSLVGFLRGPRARGAGPGLGRRACRRQGDPGGLRATDRGRRGGAALPARPGTDARRARARRCPGRGRRLQVRGRAGRPRPPRRTLGLPRAGLAAPHCRRRQPRHPWRSP